MEKSYRAYRQNIFNSKMKKESQLSSNWSGGSLTGGFNLPTTATTYVAPPKFYTPIHTQTSWQIPQKRQEVYVWCRFFGAMEPKISAALNFYSQFPTGRGYDNTCDDKIIKEYFDDLKRKLKIEEMLPMMAHEYYLLGDIFPFTSIECQNCQGTGLLPNGKICEHEGGSFGSLTLLNPDSIEVGRIPNVNMEIIYMIPDDNLKNIVVRREPREIYDRIPEIFKQKILSGQMIQLHPTCVSHISHDRLAYQPFGRSLLYRLFQTLAYKDKLRQAQWVIADRHILPIRIVKVGSDNFPAGDNDIANVTAQVYQAVNDPNFTLVTHHAVDYDFAGASGKVLQLSKEYDMITEELLDGLMINKALLNSEGPSYSNAAIGIEAMGRRLEDLQRKLANWIEEKIYRPIAIMQGFYRKNERGMLIPYYPTVKWADLSLRDDSNKKNLYMSLVEKKMMSHQTLMEFLNIDYATEIERIRMEQVLNMEYGIGGGEGNNLGGGSGGLDLGGLGGGGGGGLGGGGMGDFSGGGMAEAPGGMGGMGGGEMPQTSTPDLMAPESQPLLNSSVKSNVPVNPKYKIPTYRKPGGGLDYLMSREQRKEDLAKKQEIKQINENKKHAEESNKLFQKNKDKFMLGLSNPEWIIFKKLREAQKVGVIKYPFRLQYPVADTRMAIDFAFPSVKIAIEVDGSHHSMEQQKVYDEKKNKILVQHGWTLLRFSQLQIEDSLEDFVFPQILKAFEDKTKNLKNKE